MNIISRKVPARDIVAACNTDPLKVRTIDPKPAWARYAINNGLSFRQYSKGFELLSGPEASEWLILGFDALLQHVGKL